MAVDPLWEEYRAWATYGYCRNNPIGLIDPTGSADEVALTGKSNNEATQRHKHNDDLGVTATKSIVFGITGIIGSFAMMAAPTGVTQVAGIAVFSASFTTLALGIAQFAEVASSEENGTKATAIPQSTGEVMGTAVDLQMGGDGKTGGKIGSFVEGAALTIGAPLTALKGGGINAFKPNSTYEGVVQVMSGLDLIVSGVNIFRPTDNTTVERSKSSGRSNSGRGNPRIGIPMLTPNDGTDK